MKAVLSSQSLRLYFKSKASKLYFWLSANYFLPVIVTFISVSVTGLGSFGLEVFFWWKLNKTSPVFSSIGSQAMICSFAPVLALATGRNVTTSRRRPPVFTSSNRAQYTIQISSLHTSQLLAYIKNHFEYLTAHIFSMALGLFFCKLKHLEGKYLIKNAPHFEISQYSWKVLG